MATEHQSYITIDSVIKDYLNESEQNISKYFKCFHLAFRGFDMLGLDFFYKIQSVKLPINSNFTVNLPSDYMNWSKVGILNDDGSIIPLYYNANMTTYADLLSNRIAKTDDPDSAWLQWWGWDSNTWYNWWNGWGYTNIYGVPSGEPFVGQFKIDLDNSVILLNQNFGREYIMLEYVCSPRQGVDYFMPVQFREALIAWMWWKDGNSKSVRSHMELGARRDWRHEFYNERRNAIARYKPIRQQEIYQASQQMTRLAVKV